MWQQKQLLYNKRYTGWLWAPSLPDPGHLGPGALPQPGASTHLVGIKLRRCQYTKTWEWRTVTQKTEGWSPNFKLLQSQLQMKKAALTRAKGQGTIQSTVLAPVIQWLQARWLFRWAADPGHPITRSRGPHGSCSQWVFCRRSFDPYSWGICHSIS